MSRNAARPLSPHMTIYKWGPHMLVSIVHRVLGVGLATVGVTMFVWWLTALAMGQGAYDDFLSWATWPPALIIPIGLTWAFFQHMSTGIRHLILDIGAGYELRTNKIGALATLGVSTFLTLAMWTYILVGKA